LQVDDNEKLAQVATALADSDGSRKITFVGIGLSGDDTADYYFKIPKYEKIISSIVAHFILISDLKDTLPDMDLVRGAFRSGPYRLVENKWQPKFQKFKKILDKYELSFLWMMIRSLSGLDLNFAPGTVSTAVFSTEPDHVYEHSNEAWSFLLKELKSQTDLPYTYKCDFS